jgi:hypothetical protein
VVTTEVTRPERQIRSNSTEVFSDSCQEEHNFVFCKTYNRHWTLPSSSQWVLSADKELFPATNSRDAHAQGFIWSWVATTHPETIRTLHSFTTRYSKCLMFLVRVYWQNCISRPPVTVPFRTIFNTSRIAPDTPTLQG